MIQVQLSLCTYQITQKVPKYSREKVGKNAILTLKKVSVKSLKPLQ